MGAILFTGFPGFLGSALLPRMLRDPDASAICLVQARYSQAAKARLESLTAEHPALSGRVRLVEGDIAVDGGLAAASHHVEDVTEIHHLAAIYDLSTPRPPALRVNVDGTRRMLDLAARCPRLSRFHYVSTCYVSGRYEGTFTEDDLQVGQAFNNFYEETKFLAEVEVQERMKSGLPVTIYRPPIVVGDSKTGATQKYDGPYFVLQWLLRQPRIAILPVVGDPTRFEVNIVPCDFVIDAITHISGLAESKGRVYQLADPSPLTVEEILHVIGKATGRKIVRLPLSKRIAKAALERVPGVYQLMQIPSSAIDYFVHPTRYDSSRTQAALKDTQIRVPPFPAYVDRLVAFMRSHPEVRSAAMA